VHSLVIVPFLPPSFCLGLVSVMEEEEEEEEGDTLFGDDMLLHVNTAASSNEGIQIPQACRPSPGLLKL